MTVEQTLEQSESVQTRPMNVFDAAFWLRDEAKRMGISISIEKALAIAIDMYLEDRKQEAK